MLIGLSGIGLPKESSSRGKAHGTRVGDFLVWRAICPKEYDWGYRDSVM